MKPFIKKIHNNSDQLEHFAPSAKARWEWLMDEMIAKNKDVKRGVEVNIFGHRYIAGLL